MIADLSLSQSLAGVLGPGMPSASGLALDGEYYDAESDGPTPSSLLLPEGHNLHLKPLAARSDLPTLLMKMIKMLTFVKRRQ